jgi:hypothetical protein
MRRLVGFTVLVIALALPTLAFGVTTVSDDGALSVKNGVGKVVLSPFKGSALGRVASGKVVVVDPVFGDGGRFDLWGCDNRAKQSDTNEHVTVCTGSNLRFRVVDGRYKLYIVRATGINLSAVGRGQVTLDGRGDDPTVDSDGLYALNDSPYKSLPDFEKTFPLLTPVGG